MGIFSRKHLNSDEFETLARTIGIANREIEHIKAKIEALITNMSSLRSLTNRKLGGLDFEEEETKNIKSGVLIPE